jgi:FkbM family methyltransferase
MIIYYGISENKIDVTEICLSTLKNGNIITIPSGDRNRANYFGDPLIGTAKKIFISHDVLLKEYDHSCAIRIDLITNEIIATNETELLNKLKVIQSKLKLNYGSFNEELPEQKMAVRYLTGNEKVLEIGGNIGRNSLIIASVLTDASNLVVLESDKNIAARLTENKFINDLNFHIEKSALSNRNLIQRGWKTIPSDDLLAGYSRVDTIKLTELRQKYKVDFDTLVLDCEGAFYYILQDMPDILDNVKLIIMENDYLNITHYEYIVRTLESNNFYRYYIESGGWGPCYNNFFEVWKK